MIGLCFRHFACDIWGGAEKTRIAAGPQGPRNDFLLWSFRGGPMGRRGNPSSFRQSRREEADCRVASLLAMTGGGARSARHSETSPQTGRGNPSSFQQSRREEAGCRVASLLAMTGEDEGCGLPRALRAHAMTEGGRGHYDQSSDRSLHCGLALSISAFFRFLLQLFNCFSREIAAYLSGVSS